MKEAPREGTSEENRAFFEHGTEPLSSVPLPEMVDGMLPR
jgi:hypothetical protein